MEIVTVFDRTQLFQAHCTAVDSKGESQHRADTATLVHRKLQSIGIF